MVTVEIITIGNEILLGLVQDTNSSYLCRVVRGMGGRVRHIAIVRDEVDSIAGEVKASINRRADVIFTCGGLGPTDDDLTLSGVAEGAGIKLALDPAAREFVKRKYAELASLNLVASAEMSEPRIKMARLPEGSQMIMNPIGTAPAMALEAQGSRIISLPGVPAEMKAIVEGPLQSLLGEVFGLGSYREREVMVECNDESVLAPALRQVVAAHPDVYLKSRANRFGQDLFFRIQISASAATAAQADLMIERASTDLTHALKTAGINIKDEG